MLEVVIYLQEWHKNKSTIFFAMASRDRGYCFSPYEYGFAAMIEAEDE
jgi:hypothetical protein